MNGFVDPNANMNPWLRLLNIFTGMGQPIGNNSGIMYNNDPNGILGPSKQPNINFGVPSPDFTNPQISQNPQLDEQGFVNQRLRELYQPENEMSDRFSGLVSNFPQRNDPSNLRKIFAAISGWGSENPMAAAEGFAYAPYYRKLGDWKEQVEPLGKAADLERQYNVNQRIMAEQTIGRELELRRVQETERRNREIGERDRNKQSLDEAKYQLQAFKAANPDFKFERGMDGFLYAVNPKNPSETIKTPIQHNQVNAIELANLNAQNRLTQIAASGEQARQNIAATGAQARETKQTPAAATAPNESEKARARFNRAQEAKIEHPEWSPFIGLGPNNTVIVTPPGRNGPTAEMHNQIRAYISGLNASGVGPVSARSNTVTMITSDGREVEIPLDQVAEAEKRGARRK